MTDTHWIGDGQKGVLREIRAKEQNPQNKQWVEESDGEGKKASRGTKGASGEFIGGTQNFEDIPNAQNTVM